MYDLAQTDFSFWWIFPIVMMILCCIMMGRARKGSVMCGFGPWNSGRHQNRVADSAIDLLNKRYASGEIDKEEYEEKKRALLET